MSISLVWGYFRLPQSVPDVFDLGIVSPKMSFQTSNRDIMLKSEVSLGGSQTDQPHLCTSERLFLVQAVSFHPRSGRAGEGLEYGY